MISQIKERLGDDESSSPIGSGGQGGSEALGSCREQLSHQKPGDWSKTSGEGDNVDNESNQWSHGGGS